MPSFSLTVLKNASWVIDALECTMHLFLSAVLPERITHFVLDPVYTIQGWGFEKVKYHEDKLSNYTCMKFIHLAS